MSEIGNLHLTVIVPVSSLRDDSERLARWLKEPEIESLSVVIVLDGADLPSKLETIIRSRPQVKLLKGNFGGPGPSRNAGLAFVTTEYVCFWDSDDYPYLDRYSLGVNEISKSRGDVAIGQFEISRENLHTQNRHMRLIPHLDDLAVELSKNPGIWRFIFRTSSIQGIQFPDIPMGEDQVFIARYFSHSRKVILLDFPIYRYVKHSNIQLTKDPSSVSRLIDSTKCIVKEISNELEFSLILSISFITKQCLTILKNSPLPIKISALRIYGNLLVAYPSLVAKRSLRHFLGARARKVHKIHIALNGGLGNQLFQLASAIFHSEGRAIVLEQNIGYPRLLTSGKATITSFALPTNIEISKRERNLLLSKFANLQLRTGIKPHRKIQIRLLAICGRFFHGMYLRSKITVIVNNGLGWCPLETLSEGNDLLIGYFQSYRNQNSQTLSIIRDIFTEQRGAELQNLISLARVENPLVVHVRLGDYLNEPNFGILGVEYYKEAIQQAFDPGRHKTIWLFSDDAHRALNRIPENFRAVTRVIEEVDGSDCNTLVAMTHGKDFVIANSSFSWWAARMSVHADAQVHYPRPWFANIEDPCDLTPDEWHPHEARFQSN